MKKNVNLFLDVFKHNQIPINDLLDAMKPHFTRQMSPEKLPIYWVYHTYH